MIGKISIKNRLAVGIIFKQRLIFGEIEYCTKRDLRVLKRIGNPTSFDENLVNVKSSYLLITEWEIS